MNFHIKLLKHCNLQCDYCYEQEYFKASHALSISEIEHVLHGIKDYGQKKKINQVNLRYSGGEILTLGDQYLSTLFHISYKIFKNSSIKVRLGIQTNLTLMNEKYIDLLKKYKVSLGVSYDVYGGHRRYRNGQPEDQVILKKIEQVHKHGIRFGAIAVITKNNYKKGTKIYDFFERIPANFHILKLHPWSGKYCPEIMIDEEEYVKMLKAIAENHLERKGPSISFANIDSYVNILRNGMGQMEVCALSKNCLGSNFFIENNGDFYPCCLLRYKEFIMGNVLNDSIEIILASPVLKLLGRRYEFIKKECRGCKYLKICSGGCMANAYEEGNVLGYSKSWCLINREMFKYLGRKLKEKGEPIVIQI